MRLSQKQAQAYRSMEAIASNTYITGMGDGYIELTYELQNETDYVTVMRLFKGNKDPIRVKSYRCYENSLGKYFIKLQKRIYYGGKTMRRIEIAREIARDEDSYRGDLEIMQHCPSAYRIGPSVDQDNYYMMDNGDNPKCTGCRGLSCYECWNQSVTVGPMH